jgi:hypothetical protein
MKRPVSPSPDGGFYAVDACLGRHARRERVETGPALPIRMPMLGLLRPSELLTWDGGDNETGEVDRS